LGLWCDLSYTPFLGDRACVRKSSFALPVNGQAVSVATPSASVFLDAFISVSDIFAVGFDGFSEFVSLVLR
jgi:hypothetical protein